MLRAQSAQILPLIMMSVLWMHANATLALVSTVYKRPCTVKPGRSAITGALEGTWLIEQKNGRLSAPVL